MAEYPGKLTSANPSAFGIVDAVEVSGHRRVNNLTELYALADAILSRSKVNTNNDALGQEWWVQSESAYYRLTDWTNRRNAEGWTLMENSDSVSADLAAHKNNKSNPHSVTKSQVGLGNVDNTSDANKPISTATQTALNNIIDDSKWKGTLNSVVKHVIGLKANYNQTTHANMLYFTTDTNEIILNGSVYGINEELISQITTALGDTVRLGDHLYDGLQPESIAANTADRALKDWDSNKIIETYANVRSYIASLGEVDLSGQTTYYPRQIKTVNGRMYVCKLKFLAGDTFVLNTYFEPIDFYKAVINGNYYLT